MTETSPYAQSYDAYWRAGWRGILPLPPRKKTYPPTGYTGRDGVDPSYADCTSWSDDGDRNVCLRMPDGVIGLDVDHYDGKTGGQTLAGLVDRYGPLPPTWLSTSRDDGISGIRLYRVPVGTVLPTKLPGIELVQRHHRYAVVWPSVHPEGRTYRWIDERTGVTAGVPALVDVPDLPAAWVAGLEVAASTAEKADVDENTATRILMEMPTGEPCEHMLRHAGKALTGGDRHDSYNEAVLAVVGAGRRGCPGAMSVVPRLRAAFLSEVTQPGGGQRTRGEAEAEWRRSLHGAVAIVADEVQGTVCPDEVFVWLESVTAPAGQPEPVEPSPLDRAVARKAGELRIAELARDLLAAEKAATAPPLVGVDLASFLAQPDEDERYRVDRLWPAEGRVLLPAPAKAGKTTMVVGNLIPALVDGGLFLGEFTVQPVSRRVVLLNLEVGERTLRGWARRAGITGSDRVTVVNLRGRVGALGLGSEAGRRRLTGFLRDEDAEVVILDPLAPVLASLGLDEDSNADVARFFSWWSETLADAGVVDDMVTHHVGHGGERSRGASRLLDEPDAIWTLTKKQSRVDEDDAFGPSEQRFLHAYGRDVEHPVSGLEFDARTGRLTLVPGGPQEQRDRAFQADVLRVVVAAGAEGILHRDLVASASGVGGGRRGMLVRKMAEAGILDCVDGPKQSSTRYFLPSVTALQTVTARDGNAPLPAVTRYPPLGGNGGDTPVSPSQEALDDPSVTGGRSQ